MMRTILISLAGAASALAITSPASAQWAPSPYSYPAPQPAPYGYGAPGYGGGNAYGYGNGYGYGQVGRWTSDLQRINNQMHQLSNRGLLTGRELRQMRQNVATVQNAIHKYQRNGINRNEAHDLDRRLRNLQISMQRSARDSDTRFSNSRRDRDGYGRGRDRRDDYRWDRD
jgi:hypothetical protein